MNITELVALNKQNGGYFFDPKHMRFNGETQKTWSIKNNKVANTVTLTDKKNSNRNWTFSIKTGRTITGNIG
jgi:hypothetical protein